MQRNQPREFNASSETPRRSDGLGAVRYGIGGVVLLVAVVVLVVVPGDIGFTSALAYGSGSAVVAALFMMMLTLLYRLSVGIYRLSVSGDREREREGESGRCPDEDGARPDEQTHERPMAYRCDLAPERNLAEQEAKKAGLGDAHRIPRSVPETR